MADKETRQQRPAGLMLGLSILIIIFGIVTICAPSIFWKFMDIILGFFLLFAGISAIINTFKNQNVPTIWFLGIIGFLLTLIGVGLIFSWSQFMGTLMIWIFALWALVRGVMLIIFGLSNKEHLPLWWAILILGGLLFALAIVIAVSDKSEARTLAGICIGISTVLDGISLLVFAMKVKNNPSLQSELVNQADQNEIAQGDVVISATTVTISTNQDEQTDNQSDNK